MSLEASSSWGGRLVADPLESFIWVIWSPVLSQNWFFLLSLECFLRWNPCKFYMLFSIFHSGVNIQTGEEVAVKMVSILFWWSFSLGLWNNFLVPIRRKKVMRFMQFKVISVSLWEGAFLFSNSSKLSWSSCLQIGQ